MQPPYDTHAPYAPTPPPVPKLDFGHTVSTAFKIYKARFSRFLGVAAIAAAVVFISMSIVMVLSAETIEQWGYSLEHSSSFSSQSIWWFSVALGVVMGLSSLVGYWGSLACCVVADGELKGNQMSLGQASRIAISRLRSLVPIGLALGVVYVFLMVGMVWWINHFMSTTMYSAEEQIVVSVLAFILIICILSIGSSVLIYVFTSKWFVTHPVMVAENTTVWKGISRSNSLTKGSAGIVFLIILVMGFAIGIVAQLVIMPMSFAMSLSQTLVDNSALLLVASLFAGCLVAMFVIPIMPIISQVVYWNRTSLVEHAR